VPTKPDDHAEGSRAGGAASDPADPSAAERLAGSSPAFDPETVHLLGEIYEAAVRELESTRPDLMAKETRSEVFMALTKHLLAAAHSGERDPEVLRKLALAAVGRK
jgi:hypothetical protein